MTLINAADNKWDARLAPKSLPDGEYLVFVSEAFPDHSKSGTAFVEVTFTVHDPANPAKGRSLKFNRFWLSEKALPRFVRFLRACGSVKPFDAQNKTAVEEALLDRIVRITVKTTSEEYKGERRDKTEAAFFAPPNKADLQRLREEYGETMLPPLDGDGHSDELDDTPF
jgi:hypothetical protein